MENVETTAQRFERARLFFDAADFVTAARLLDQVVTDEPAHTAARLLLARAYFHSAQLRRAEEQARLLVARDPSDDYAHLLLGRSLQRQSRHDEARPHLRMADVMRGQIA
jgi:cytochrome c-type biogenesis protein CcmH/NrfG